MQTLKQAIESLNKAKGARNGQDQQATPGIFPLFGQLPGMGRPENRRKPPNPSGLIDEQGIP